MHARFRLIRLLEGHMVCSDCELKIDIDISKSCDTAVAKNRLKAMKLWLEDFVDGCVAYDVHTDVDTTFLEHVSNHVMMAPTEPHDYLLLSLLHAKLSAIGGGDIIIRQTHLMTDTNEGFSNSLSGTTDDMLPAISEWMGDRRFHESPWWHRTDSSMMDLKPEPDDDLTVMPELGDDLLKLVSPAKDSGGKPAEIIRVSFKPRVIDGED